MPAPMFIPTEVIDTLHRQNHSDDAFLISDDRRNGSSQALEPGSPSTEKDKDIKAAKAKQSSSGSQKVPKKNRFLRIPSFRRSLSQRKAMEDNEDKVDSTEDPLKSSSSAESGPPMVITLEKSLSTTNLENCLNDDFGMQDPYDDAEESSISSSSNSSENSLRYDLTPSALPTFPDSSNAEDRFSSMRPNLLPPPSGEFEEPETPIRSNSTNRLFRSSSSVRGLERRSSSRSIGSCNLIMESSPEIEIAASAARLTDSPRKNRKKTVRSSRLKRSNSTSRLIDLKSSKKSNGSSTTTTNNNSGDKKKKKKSTSKTNKDKKKSKESSTTKSSSNDKNKNNDGDQQTKRTKKTSARRTHKAPRRLSSSNLEP